VHTQQLGYHQGQNDFWVAVRGEVYDLTNFWRGDHSDIQGDDVTNALMLELAGQVRLCEFPVPVGKEIAYWID
jgi:chitin synthase